jgi:hypothetical protein
LIGKLQVNSPSAATSNIATPRIRTYYSTLSKITGRIDDAITGIQKMDEQHLNLRGIHAGNLTVNAIVLTCWIVIGGKHRLRYKILDVLEEIGESAGG